MSQIYEYIKMAVSNIKSNKVRSFLTMLGIIIGISSVILIVSIGNGAKNVITEALAGIAEGQICITSKNDEEYNITTSDMEAIKANVPDVKAISLSMTTSGTTSTKKGDFSIGATGALSEQKYFSGNTISKGRYFTESEYDSGTPVCVVTEKDAIRLYGTADVIGMTLDVDLYGRAVTFRIIGLEKQKASALNSFVYEGTPINITFPMTVFRDAFYFDVDSFNQIYILAKDGANTYSVAQQCQNLIEKRHKCVGEEKYRVENFSDYMNMTNTIINMVTILISFIAAISLFVGGIGVMNIMLVSVTERTREIGIRKSLGAKTRSIMVQFLSESAIITMVGGIIGIMAGVGGAYLVSGVIGIIAPDISFSPSISILTIISATVFSAVVGIFFGIYPASKAAKLSPIEALRRQ